MVRASDDLTLRYAQQHVAHFRDEDRVKRTHREAMDCCDCEAFLQLGIDAFDWLVRADTVIRQAIYRGVYAHDPQVEAVLQDLFRSWLEPCEYAEQWIQLQECRGSPVANLSKFRECREEVRAIVESFDNGEETMPAPLADLRDQALEEHRNGQTSEFF